MGIIDFILSGRLFGGSGGDGSYDEGFADGKKSEYDKFWDTYQTNGERTNYAYAFQSTAWTDKIFVPKYPIIPISTARMFDSTLITDISNIDIDFSQAVDFSFPLSGSRIKHIGIIDTRSANTIEYLFYQAYYLETVDKVILREDMSQSPLQDTFYRADALKEIRFENLLHHDLKFFRATALSVASMKDIIAHLYDYSNDPDEAYLYTLSFTQACWSALEEDSAAPNGGTWREYVTTLGWNVG